MNMFFHGVIASGVETLRARVNFNMERGAGKFCSKWILADTGYNGFLWLGNITDMDGMGVSLPNRNIS